MNITDEWLEPDGCGGFASGTAAGIRTRRYHALLLVSRKPPTDRVVLVNGFDAWLETEQDVYSLSSQQYGPEIVHPDGARWLESFDAEPFPRWLYQLPDGTQVEFELFVPHGAQQPAGWGVPTRNIEERRSKLRTSQAIDGGHSPPYCALTALRWRRLQGSGRATLKVRPFFSGRDYHALHHENPAFCFDPVLESDGLTWQPYADVPATTVQFNGQYEHQPDWYRNFFYQVESERGLDCSEDLASPGVFRWQIDEGDAICLLTASDTSSETGSNRAAEDVYNELRGMELARRTAFPSALHRAGDAYIVRRGDVSTDAGKTIIAGYPWFTDWGRDTFIALRGLCIATGRLDDACDILSAWAETVSQGMLPNRFPDHGDEPEFNAVDASLWFIVAVHDYLSACQTANQVVEAATRERLIRAVYEILEGYSAGTRYGIRLDDDGLIAAGEPGVQLTWMDAKVGDWVVTPRIGKPVEVEALWLNALWVASRFDSTWSRLFEKGRRSFEERFWDPNAECLYDVVDCDHHTGSSDASFRPNQIFAVGGLPIPLLDPEQSRQVVAAVEQQLWTPLGLRSLAPSDPSYRGRYGGGVYDRDGAYHQGTVWGWLIGPFVEAWVRVRGSSGKAKSEARKRFLEPLLQHLKDAGIGHLSEIADGDPPYTPRGCPFQAWSVGEALRLSLSVLAGDTGSGESQMKKM